MSNPKTEPTDNAKKNPDVAEYAWSRSTITSRCSPSLEGP